MKQLIHLPGWDRADQYGHFSAFEEPFFGVTVRVDCTHAYRYAKEQQRSFFLVYLHDALRAANRIPEFRYRIEDGQVVLFDTIHAAPTIDRPGRTFGFGYIDFHENEHTFHGQAALEIARVRDSTGLQPSKAGDNVIHFSSLPWLDFTALSHPRRYSLTDSCPKISFGKMTEHGGVQTMPVSIHVHHALADGQHVGAFVETFQRFLDAHAQ